MNASRVPYVPPEGALLRALRGAGPLDAEEEVIQVLSHAARFTTDYLTATRRASEQEGVHLMAGRVRAPEGISQAYRAFRADGWMGAAIPVSEGGSGLSFPLQFALTEMWAAGDAAFNQLVLGYQDRLVGLLRHLVQDQTAAEDLAQEVFLRVFRASWFAASRDGRRCSQVGSRQEGGRGLHSTEHRRCA